MEPKHFDILDSDKHFDIDSDKNFVGNKKNMTMKVLATCYEFESMRRDEKPLILHSTPWDQLKEA